MLNLKDYIDLPNDVLMRELLRAYQEIRDINIEMKEDEAIKEKQEEITLLKAPYKERLLEQKSKLESVETIARSRGLLKKEK